MTDEIPGLSPRVQKALAALDPALKVRREEMNDYIGRYFQRVYQNLNRADRLVQLGERIGGSDGDELLRASVVLLHATFEDFLRVFAGEWIVARAPASVAGIPLVKDGDQRRGDKFTLSELAEHHGKTVDTVVAESVRHYLDTKSFGNMTEVATLTEQCGWKLDDAFETVKGTIAAMMRRRHQIVHRADIVDGDKPVLAPITADEVRSWNEVVSDFFYLLMSRAVTTKFKDVHDDLERVGRLPSETPRAEPV